MTDGSQRGAPVSGTNRRWGTAELGAHACRGAGCSSALTGCCREKAQALLPNLLTFQEEPEIQNISEVAPFLSLKTCCGSMRMLLCSLCSRPTGSQGKEATAGRARPKAPGQGRSWKSAVSPAQCSFSARPWLSLAKSCELWREIPRTSGTPHCSGPREAAFALPGWNSKRHPLLLPHPQLHPHPSHRQVPWTSPDVSFQFMHLLPSPPWNHRYLDVRPSHSSLVFLLLLCLPQLSSPMSLESQPPRWLLLSPSIFCL